MYAWYVDREMILFVAFVVLAAYLGTMVAEHNRRKALQ